MSFIVLISTDQLSWADATQDYVNNSQVDGPISNVNFGSSNAVEDLFVGKIPNHSIINIELDPTISSKSIVPFISRMIAGYSRRNEAMVTFVPPSGVTPQNIDLLLKAFIPNTRQRKRVDVFYKTSALNESNDCGFIQELEKTAIKIRRKEKKPELLGVFSVGPYFDGDGGSVLELNKLIETVISSYDSAIIVTRSTEKFYKLSEIADVRLKIVELEGNLFVQPENPWASLYAIQNEKNGEIISVRPMV